MRVGTLIRGTTIDEIVENVAGYRRSGYTSAWLTDGVGMEPLTTLAAVGRAVPEIELGTAVVRTHPRHPMAMAQHALTVNALVGGRLTLGIGPSHQPSVQGTWGLSFERPIRHLREYLSVLGPLVTEGSVSFDGETVSAHGQVLVEGGSPVPVLLGALGPQMLQLAGRLADGAITFMTGPRTLVDLTCPTIHEAAERAARATPRIVALLAFCVTEDVEASRARAEQVAGPMALLPSYAAALRREGGPALITGTENEVADQVRALELAGVTDLVPIPVARRGSKDHERTSALLSELLGRQPQTLRAGAPVEGVDEQPEPAVVEAVEAEGDSR
ncbi:MAG TPA: TIGR03564 family F420-dependent LLM class oxidoreductase [Acidimicrobiales bacterium]|nr:TIGR03564 family F420-dependent LLM class oxidoreductase [Acidimicrobiales bacterium]